MSSSEFHWPVRVYYEDTDSGGVVYYANYLRFMERARTEWLRSLGVEQDILRDREDIAFAVRSAQLEFLRPGKFNDLLVVVSTVNKRGPASMVFDQEIVRDDNDRETLCTGRVKVACLNATTWRAQPIPAHIMTEIFGDH